MAVTGISHKEAVERQHKLEAWSGVISWTLYGLLAVLVVAVVLVLIEGQRKETRITELRAAWDQYYLAFKDKEAANPRGLENAERIPILEGLWEKTKGTPVQPFVALELAQAHFRESEDAIKDPQTGQRTRVEESFKKQNASLKKARDVFNTVRTNWPDNPSYGPLGFEGAALCSEQLKEYGEAIDLLEDAVKRYPKHFLAEKMRYDLARNYWLRALEAEATGKTAAEDRAKALDHVSRAVSEVADKHVSPMSWRFQARYLRSLLEKRDETLKIFPDGKPPAKPAPVPPSANAPTQGQPANPAAEPAKANVQPEQKPEPAKQPEAEKKPAEAKSAPETTK